jgi:hypothetical protein
MRATCSSSFTADDPSNRVGDALWVWMAAPIPVRRHGMGSAGSMEEHAPEPVATIGQSQGKIASRTAQEQGLESVRPTQSTGKAGVKAARHFEPGLFPGDFPTAIRRQAGGRPRGRFECHGHAVAGDGRDHGPGIAQATIGAGRIGSGSKVEPRNGRERFREKLRGPQTIVQDRSGRAPQEFRPAIGEVWDRAGDGEQSAGIDGSAVELAQAHVAVGDQMHFQFGCQPCRSGVGFESDPLWTGAAGMDATSGGADEAGVRLGLDVTFPFLQLAAEPPEPIGEQLIHRMA